jgi:threonine dehydratase
MPAAITFADIELAARRIADFAHRTPVLSSSSIDDIAGCKIAFKCENFQRVGAFKFRGACNAVWSLSDEVSGRRTVCRDFVEFAGARVGNCNLHKSGRRDSC